MKLIKWVASDLHACGHCRGEVMAREVNEHVTDMQIDLKNCIVMSDFYKTKLIVFQRSCIKELLVKIKLARSLNIKTIYELDDDIFHIPPEFEKPYQHYADPHTRQCIIDCIDHADAVTVSTIDLARSLALVFQSKPIFVIENALDVKEWNLAHSKRMERVQVGRDRLVIGWMASGSHVIDVPLVRDAFEIVLEKYPNTFLHLIGWVGFEDLGLSKFKDRIICEDWLPIEQIPYAMSNFDINLCPLIDNQFNRCKSGLKFMQGSALGLPSICSKLAPYSIVEDNVDGMIADSPAEWLACLEELIENAPLRLELGAKARVKVIEKYDMAKNYVQWVNTFENILKG